MWSKMDGGWPLSSSTDVRPEGPNDMDNADERWLSRRELAERYGLPVKTLAVGF